MLQENVSRLRAQRFLQNLQFRSKNIMFHGVIFCFYFLAVIVTLIIFVVNVSVLNFSDGNCSLKRVRPGFQCVHIHPSFRRFYFRPLLEETLQLQGKQPGNSNKSAFDGFLRWRLCFGPSENFKKSQFLYCLD